MAMVPASTRRGRGSAWDRDGNPDGVSEFISPIGGSPRVRVHRQADSQPIATGSPRPLGKQAVILLLRVCNVLLTFLIPLLGLLWLL